MMLGVPRAAAGASLATARHLASVPWAQRSAADAPPSPAVAAALRALGWNSHAGVAGTGPRGRVLKSDVLAYAAAGGAPLESAVGVVGAAAAAPLSTVSCVLCASAGAHIVGRFLGYTKPCLLLHCAHRGD